MRMYIHTIERKTFYVVKEIVHSFDTDVYYNMFTGFYEFNFLL